MESSNKYVTISSSEYEKLKLDLERANRLVNNISRENREINRQNVVDTRTMVRLQNENESLKTINEKLMQENIDLRTKLRNQ